ncbi:MAG: hypothetical protein M1819_000529 [Sarea resinae]|nr:MAG: hypothetical protein M1819_000529 [Sarea resinae]
MALAQPPRELDAISHIESSLRFPHFTADDAYNIGSQLRRRLLDFDAPAVVNISLANGNQLLYHACSRSGTTPDNDTWVSRKRKTVLRWGVSTWYMHNKLSGNEAAFAAKYMLSPSAAGEYAIHGGGFPVKVKGVEGVVGVIVVSGLKQEEDHQVVVEVVGKYLREL